MAVIVNRSAARFSGTPEYKPTQWKAGDYIRESGLNNLEQATQRGTSGLKFIEDLLKNLKLEVNVLEAGESGSGAFNFDEGKLIINTPKGDKGERGLQGIAGQDGRDGRDGAAGANGKDGINGTNGTNGTNGKNGASFRIATTAVTADANNEFSKLKPDNAKIPVAIGDTVLDKTNKKLYEITAVNAGTSKFTAVEIGQLA